MTDDIDRIMDVMAEAFDPEYGEAWNRRQITDSIVLPLTNYYLITATGKTPDENEIAAGFALTRSAPGEEELLLIGVRPSARGAGLGRRLLDRFMSEAKRRGAEKVFLEMRANNPAEHLYRSAGFEPIGQRKDYYLMRDGKRIDAITFGKVL